MIIEIDDENEKNPERMTEMRQMHFISCLRNIYADKDIVTPSGFYKMPFIFAIIIPALRAFLISRFKKIVVARQTPKG